MMLSTSGLATQVVTEIAELRKSLDASRAELRTTSHDRLEEIERRQGAEVDRDDAVAEWISADEELRVLGAAFQVNVTEQAERIRQLCSALDNSRGDLEAINSAFVRGQRPGTPANADAVIGFFADFYAVARSQDSAADSGSEANLVLMRQLDDARGWIEAVKSFYVASKTSTSDTSDEEIVQWLSSMSWQGSAELEAKLGFIRNELFAVTNHRDALTAELLAVCSSESWRLGYALTWPARRIKLLFKWIKSSAFAP